MMIQAECARLIVGRFTLLCDAWIQTKASIFLVSSLRLLILFLQKYLAKRKQKMEGIR